MAGELRFFDLLNTLARHEVEFVGVAAILEGAPISTFDLDVVFHRTAENNARLAAALRQLNACYNDPAGRHIVPDSSKLDSINIHLLRTDLGPLDLLSRVGRNLTYEMLLNRSIDYEVVCLRLKVLNLETIIECKEFADRDKDRAALPILR